MSTHAASSSAAKRSPRRLVFVALAMITAVATIVIGNLAPTANTPPALAAERDNPSFVLNQNDLEFILRQIQVSEAHAAGGPLRCAQPTGDTSGKCVAGDTRTTGVRTVDGSYNNLLAGQSEHGGADNVFPRLLEAEWLQADPNPAESEIGGPPPNDPAILTMCDPGLTCYEQTEGFVYDAEPRVISNLIVDQTIDNPAILRQIENGTAEEIPGTGGRAVTPNSAPDEALSAPFNTFMGFFGQFFDHGLDLVGKGGNGTIVVPLDQADDPLCEVECPELPFLTLTRATRSLDEGGNPTNEHVNLTTPFIDQNQTYSSHPSHQVFLREYELRAVDGYANEVPVATGRLIEGAQGGMATWADVKSQAANILGLELTDSDLLDIPQIATDPYGNMLRGENGFPQYLTTGAPVEGDPANPVPTPEGVALGTGHAFLDDIAHGATPVIDPVTGELLPRFNPDGSPVLDENGQPVLTGYDPNELNKHFIAGDGRVNENIGLTAVHHVFHSEHNRMVGQIEELLAGGMPELESGNLEEFVKAFRGEAHAFPSDKAGEELPQPEGDDWSYEERLFQAAKFATEMQYQHLVFEEFGRKVAPAIGEVVFNENSYRPQVDPAIFAEFAHVVYRFGHSIMTEEIGREAVEDGTVAEFSDVPLLDGFLDPDAYDLNSTLSAEEAAGSLINGMTGRVGSQIDEHVVDTLRNNLLGLPLDLATLNLLRGRDTGVPPLQEAREMFYAATGDEDLMPYDDWYDFGLGIKDGDNFGRGAQTESLVNFVAAYGTHPTIEAAATMAEKRDAASILVNGVPSGEQFLGRISGENRFATAANTSFSHFAPGVPVAYITNGLNFPDALAGASIAAANESPILLATPVGLPEHTKAELARLQPQNIVVLGGTGAVGADVMALLDEYTLGTVSRVGGVDRFETAAMLSAQAFDPGVAVAYVANAMDFPDALAGGAVAARDGSPILLTDQGTLDARTAAELDRLNPGRIVVLGGAGVVSTSVLVQLAAFTDGTVSRIGGADRYETAAMISAAAYPTGADVVYISTGTNFPDALTAAPVAGLQNAPLLLTPPDALHPAIAAELDRLNPSRIIILGGTGALSPAIEAALGVFAPDPLTEEEEADRQAFMHSEGIYAHDAAGEATTGLEDVEFWIGGLAEKVNAFGGMLGSTFNYVFQLQLENLQFGDRFYYLFRNQGQQLFAALEGNTFSDMIQRNTDASNLPADVFALHDPIIDLDNLPAELPEGLVVEADGTYRWVGDEHVELHATDGDDRLQGDEGDDAIFGYDGNDRILGGAGADSLVGGVGDDIITDAFGDDNIKGKQGNDAINTGPGFDLALGGLGDDFVMNGGDAKTNFMGMGNDISYGTNGRMTVFGGEHDDWIEGGMHADLLQADNGEQFQNDTLGGNDVVIGGLGNDDIEGEGGDDVLIGNAVGTDRHLGNIGFDWLTYYGQTANVRADMSMDRFNNPTDPLPSRFDQLEALSGGAGNDTLLGPISEADDIPENVIPLNQATQETLDLIGGLEDLLRPPGAAFDYAAPIMRGTPEADVDGVHKIMIAGPGSDTVMGRGGNDFLDGDAMLRVRLYHAPTDTYYNSAGEVQAAVFAGTVNPGDLDIVRDIVPETDATTAIDTAQYQNPFDAYTLQPLPDGYWQIVHTLVQEPEESDGTDVIRGFERLQFADGCAELDEDTNTWVSCEVTMVVELSTDSPVEDVPIDVVLFEPDGVTPFDTTGVTNLQYTWWAGEGDSPETIGEWEQVVIPGGASTNPYSPDDSTVGQYLRVSVSYTDSGGNFRAATSPTTANVVENVNDVPTGISLLFQNDPLAPTVGQLISSTFPTDGDGIEDVVFTYEWTSSTDPAVPADAADLQTLASTSVYTTQAGDVGRYIRVTISYTDNLGGAEIVSAVLPVAVGAAP